MTVVKEFHDFKFQIKFSESNLNGCIKCNFF